MYAYGARLYVSMQYTFMCMHTVHVHVDKYNTRQLVVARIGCGLFPRKLGFRDYMSTAVDAQAAVFAAGKCPVVELIQ